MYRTTTHVCTYVNIHIRINQAKGMLDPVRSTSLIKAVRFFFEFDLPKSLIWKAQQQYFFKECLPITAANPLTKVSVPKPDVRRSRPDIDFTD